MQISILQSLKEVTQSEKGVVRRWQFSEQVAVNMHTMGTSFVGKVKDVGRIARHTALRGGVGHSGVTGDR